MNDWKKSLKAVAKELGLYKKKTPKKIAPPITKVEDRLQKAKKSAPTKSPSMTKSTEQLTKHRFPKRAPRVFSKDGVKPLRSKTSPVRLPTVSMNVEDAPISQRVRRALTMARFSAPRPMAGYDNENHIVRSVHALGQRWNRFDLHGFHY